MFHGVGAGADAGHVGAHCEALGGHTALHLFIVYHDPSLALSSSSDAMKKLFGRDKPKAVKVTSGPREDVAGLGEV